MGLLKNCKKFVLDMLFKRDYLRSSEEPSDTIWKLPCDKLFRLDIPTYDGSGQAVHPSLLRRPDSPWFMLAFTPYTDTHDDVENPSVLISDTGLDFYEEKKGINPLVGKPEFDHNDDPDLFFRDGKYCILYLETMRPKVQTLYVLESEDRIYWKKQEVCHWDLESTRDFFMLSPKYMEFEGKEFIFYVNRDAKGGYAIECSGLGFTETRKVLVPGLKEYPWHIDIIPSGEAFYMLITTASTLDNNARYSLRIAKSGNLFDWKLAEDFCVEDCYRSSGFVENGILFAYLSKIFLPTYHRKKWKIMLLKKRLDMLRWGN